MTDNTPDYVYLLNALTILKSDVEYTTGPYYDDIVWKTNGTNIPSREIIDSKVLELKNGKPLLLLRQERKLKLNESDYLAMPDYPHATVEIKQSWLDYRQALRNLPSNSSPQLDDNGELTNVNWPIPPS